MKKKSLRRCVVTQTNIWAEVVGTGDVPLPRCNHTAVLHANNQEASMGKERRSPASGRAACILRLPFANGSAFSLPIQMLAPSCMKIRMGRKSQG